MHCTQRIALTLSLVVGIVCTAAASSSTPMRANPAPSALQELINAANKEGRVIWSSTDAPEVVAALNKRFNERFGTNIKVETIPLRAVEAITRAREEARAGKITVDLFQQVPSAVLQLVEGKVPIFEDFDYVGTLGRLLPGIEKAVERLPKEVRGLGLLEYQHLIRVIFYNKALVAKKDAPRSWGDLLDAKWKGRKISIDPSGASTYQNVARWDEARVLDYSLRLGKQEPLWAKGTSEIARVVARGEAAVGITSLNQIKEWQEKVEIAPAEFYPATQQVLILIKNSPRVHAARLFSAFMATEGMQLATELGETSERGYPDSGTWSAKKIAELGGELAMLTSKHFDVAEKVRETISREYRKAGLR